MNTTLRNGNLCIERFVVNMIEENTYLLFDAHTRDAVLIDCGARSEEEHAAITERIEALNLHLTAQWNTHGHFDHIWGTQWAADKFGAPLVIASDELPTLEAASRQAALFLHRDLGVEVPQAARTVSHGDTLSCGSHVFQVLATPGHTPGGICFYCAEEKVLLSGDSLFLESIGRCDLPGGDGPLLVKSLQERILSLPPDTEVLPGHGPTTTIDHERRFNPYV